MQRRRDDQTERTERASTAFRDGLALVVRIVGVLALVATVSATAFGAWTFLRESDAMRIRVIDLQGAKHSTPQSLLAASGITPGLNIFAVDLAVAAQEMEHDGWVQRAQIWRELPDTIRIRITERTAVALVVAGGLYASDANGLLFRRILPTDGLDLPVITGLQKDASAGDLRDADAGLATALSLVAAYTAHPLQSQAPLAEVHVGEESGETVYTLFCGDEPVELALGDVDPSRPDATAALLGRVQQVWEELKRKGAHARRIDVGNRRRPEWIAVRLDEDFRNEAPPPRGER